MLHKIPYSSSYFVVFTPGTRVVLRPGNRSEARIAGIVFSNGGHLYRKGSYGMLIYLWAPQRRVQCRSLPRESPSPM